MKLVVLDRRTEEPGRDGEGWGGMGRDEELKNRGGMGRDEESKNMRVEKPKNHQFLLHLEQKVAPRFLH